MRVFAYRAPTDVLLNTNAARIHPQPRSRTERAPHHPRTKNSDNVRVPCEAMDFRVLLLRGISRRCDAG